MKALNLLAILAVFSALISPMFAQKTGFFISVGAGVADLDTGLFVVFDPTTDIPGGEPLASTKTKSSVSVARLTGGYSITENWAVQASYATYGTGTAYPALPGRDLARRQRCSHVQTLRP